MPERKVLCFRDSIPVDGQMFTQVWYSFVFFRIVPVLSYFFHTLPDVGVL